MKKNLSVLLLFCLTLLSSCEVVGGIFKAGMWTTVIIIVAVIALIMFIVGRARK
jgi:hypothetical protein